MYLEMLVRRFLTHPEGVLDSSPLAGTPGQCGSPPPPPSPPAWPPERFPSASGTKGAEVLTRGPSAGRRPEAQGEDQESWCPARVGLPFAGRAVPWAGRACSVKTPSLHRRADEARASWGKVRASPPPRLAEEGRRAGSALFPNPGHSPLRTFRTPPAASGSGRQLLRKLLRKEIQPHGRSCRFRCR